MEEEKQTVQVQPQPETAEVAAAFKRSQEIQREQLYKRINLNMRAHSRGEVAKSNGWARISPYYNDAVSDDFWFKGFDGVSFDQAIRCDIETITSNTEPHPA